MESSHLLLQKKWESEPTGIMPAGFVYALG